MSSDDEGSNPEEPKIEDDEAVATIKYDTDESCDSDGSDPELSMRGYTDEVALGPIDLETDPLGPLISYFMKITFLIDLQESDWNLKTQHKIREYLLKKDVKILTIFFNEDELQAEFTFPKYPIRVSDIMFFKKYDDYPGWEQITVDNLMDYVEISNFSEHPEENAVVTFEKFVVPTLYKMPSNELGGLKPYLIAALQRVMCGLVEMKYQLYGLSGLYVPPEGLNKPVEKAAKNKDTVKRLNELLLRWYGTIAKVLHENETWYPMDSPHLLDVEEYWTERHNNLCGIWSQLKNPEVKRICDILETGLSPFLTNFYQQIGVLKTKKIEAKSNSKYLKLFVGPVMLVQMSNDVKEFLTLMPTFLLNIRFIWTRSPYYTQEQYIQTLSFALANQLVDLCKHNIDFKLIFDEKRPIEAKRLFKSMVGTCESFCVLYRRAVELHNKHHSKLWKVNEKEVFSLIDRMIQRGKDVIEICNTMKVFGRIDETTVIPKPTFGWTRAKEYEKVIDKIESMYLEYLGELEGNQDTIFDLFSNEWHENMLKYNEGIRVLEVLVENLLTNCFSIVNNVEEGIDAIQVLYQYSKRPLLFAAFERASKNVHILFLKELRCLKKDLIMDRSIKYDGLPPHASKALINTQKSKRLEMLYNMLTDAQWMIQVPFADEIDEQYHIVQKALEDCINSSYKNYVTHLTLDLEPQLEWKVMVRKEDGTLAANFVPSVLQMIYEGECWRFMDKPLPPSMSKLQNVFSKLLANYGTINLIVNEYNSLMARLSETERILFSDILIGLDNHLKPGFLKYTWGEDFKETVLTDWLIHINNITEFIDDYKICNLEIAELCKQIYLIKWVDFPRGHSFTLEEFIQNTEASRNEASAKLVECFNVIVRQMLSVYEGFEEHLETMYPHWFCYVEKIDNLVESCILFSVKLALEHILKNIQPHDLDGSSINFKLTMLLKNTKVYFRPSMFQVANEIISIFPKIVFELLKVYRLFDKFKLREKVKKPPYAFMLFMNKECNSLLEEIEIAIGKSVQDVASYVRTWDDLKEIWEMSKDTFIARFEQREPKAKDYDNDIHRFYKHKLDVTDMVATNPVTIFLIDSSVMIETASQHCDVWIHKLTNSLFRSARDQIEGFYRYCAENNYSATFTPEVTQDLVRIRNSQKLMHENKQKMLSMIPDIRERVDLLLHYRHDIPRMIVTRQKGLRGVWKGHMKALQSSEQKSAGLAEKFRAKLCEETVEFKKEVRNLLEDFRANGPFTNAWTPTEALQCIADLRDKLAVQQEVEAGLRRDLPVVDVPYEGIAEFELIVSDMATIEYIWNLVLDWDNTWQSWKVGLFWDVNVDNMESAVVDLFKLFTQLLRDLKEKNWPIIEQTRKELDGVKRVLPLITDLKNPAMRQRHWDTVRHLVNYDFDEMAADFTLELIMQIGVQNYEDDVHEVSVAATAELNIENALFAIKGVWAVTVLDLFLHREGIYRVKSVDKTQQMVEEHLSQIGTMKGTRYSQPFITEVEFWEKGLTLTQETIESILNIQRQFLYLEIIFQGEDIRKQLPAEAEQYDLIGSMWSEITTGMFTIRNVFESMHMPGLQNKLEFLDVMLESISKSLESYLETKRNVFPRFYFVSNDDLFEILGCSKKVELIQPHFKKCFDNVNKVKMEKHPLFGRIDGTGMYSADGEFVKWSKNVIMEGPVESWFCTVEDVMRISLKDELRNTIVGLKKMLLKRDQWIKDYPGQMCITASQIQWTADCTRALISCKQIGRKAPLKKLRSRQNQVLSKFLSAIRSSLSKTQRLKVVSIVTIEIHARDVIEKMFKTNTTDVAAFEWMSQLRFYWDAEIDDCIIRQTNTLNVYGYEYLGNSGRLVITPLTDRCYITLTTALHLYRGGSPKGPAGTGKTETVKDLGKGLALYVIVINCSEGLDFKSMGRMFAGLAQSGSWGCFDEFNRINIEVLSVVAQQILSVLSALSANLKRFVFEGCSIRLIKTCGIFITMNPGYAGRTELPDNLKSMFRPISMMVPDTGLIAEITLFGEGFEECRTLAKKVFTLFSLCKQQLSKQDHYDFGLRSLVALLRYAGKKRRLLENIAEEAVMLLAMKDMNIARLTAEDLPLFNGVIKDLFPGVETPALDYEAFYTVLRELLHANNYQSPQIMLTKVVQLMETKGSRHSVMLMGQTGAAKTVTWKMLAATMTTMHDRNIPGYERVKELPMNPKAVTLDELYGYFNIATNEWYDGVLSAIMRTACAEETPAEKWILFDGPVDAVWIENMNSVMDDNKVLTLINGERITMPEQVSLLFEVEDLAVASPATVSRCGTVFNDYTDFGWTPYAQSWLQKMTNELARDTLTELFDTHVNELFRIKNRECKEIVTIPEIAGIVSMCTLLKVLFDPDSSAMKRAETDDARTWIKCWFLFCSTWSILGSLDENSRFIANKIVRELEPVYPMKDTIYEYFVSPDKAGFVHWETLLDDNWSYDPTMAYFKIIVPTVDTLRYEYLTSNLLNANIHVLIMGSVGTGKTSTALSVIEKIGSDKYSLLNIVMSAQTTAANVQERIESKLEKWTRGVYGPVGGKTMIILLDDMNMPAKEIYGAQPPLELMRQWVDFEFWYNRANQQRVTIKKMLLLGAMGPPGGGRNQISNRFLSKFNLFNMGFPDDAQISRIFATLLSQHLEMFEDAISSSSTQMTRMTVDLYKTVVATMLPTPKKMHYLFNLRDISRVFQGLLRSNHESQTNLDLFLRLWYHEVSRVFSDRLIDDTDLEWFTNEVDKQLKVVQSSMSALCPDRENPLFGDFTNDFGLYEEITDMVKLRKLLENKLHDYNNSPGSLYMNLVFFRMAIDHICRIARILGQPRGHVLVIGIGGFGRQSLSRFATFLCGYELFRIQLTNKYSSFEFKEDLKILYVNTGLKDRKTSFVFMDDQIMEETMLEIVNNILSTGEVTNLFKTDEFEEIREGLIEVLRKLKMSLTPEEMVEFFYDRVRTNLHVVLLMTPVGESFRTRLRQYPSVINCTTIDWFLDWPEDALLEVAKRFVDDVDMLATIFGEDDKPADQPDEEVEGDEKEEVVDVENPELKQERITKSVAKMCAVMHTSVMESSNKMLLQFKRYNYVTPTIFLELVSGYIRVLKEKRELNAQMANKLRQGFGKIDETKAAVDIMKTDLEVATAKVNQTSKECQEFLVTLMVQKQEADIQAAEVTAKSEKIAIESVECEEMAAMALADLAEAMPALEAALKALDSLNKKDVAELKAYGRPPAKVEMVMEAVMILKKSEPSWAEAKRQLADVNFLLSLREFDKDHVSDKTLKKVGVYSRNPEFEPEKIGAVSTAAKGLALWVLAIEKYAKVYRVVAPKKAKADAAKAELAQKQQELRNAQESLAKLNALLQKLKDDYDEKLRFQEQLQLKAQYLINRLARAETLTSNLAGERVRWELTVRTLGENFEFLIGNCLLATAFTAYLGPFMSEFREELRSLWLQEVHVNNVPLSPDFIVTDFLMDPAIVQDWNIQGLPTDDFSMENGIIIMTATKWPFIIDPQCQAMKWIKNKYGKDLVIVDFGMPDFMKYIEEAMNVGLPVLLQNVMEFIDPSLMPVLEKLVVQRGNYFYIQLGERMLEYNLNFKLFVTTKMPNPHYPPNVSTKTTLVNFAIKPEGLEDQLLGTIVKREKPKLEQMKFNLVSQISGGKRKLIELEDALLNELNSSKGNLLDNDELFITLKDSKIISAEVNEQLEVSIQTNEEIDSARNGYRPCAYRASILFFVLTDMARIDPMYQFSLDAYILLFQISIQRSKKSDDLATRLANLNQYHTYAVYRNTCRGLFEQHKLLFSFHVSVKILKPQGVISEDQYQFLLKGGVVLDRSDQAANKNSEWLVAESWDNITELEKLEGFDGLVDSFRAYSDYWHDWFLSTDPENRALPAPYEETLSCFQKMLIIRSVRPDRLFLCIATFIELYIGREFVEPPVLEIKAVFEDSTNSTPLIFVLSPGVDPTGALINLAQNMGMGKKFRSLSLGQGQAPIATRQIKEGVEQGFWVFLANCHLSLSWMPTLDKIIDVIQGNPRTHTNFRLWLSSSPHPDFPISILQSSIKMTTEPPKGLKANMTRMYNMITDEQFATCKSQMKYKRLLFSLCFLHSVLIERKKFQQLGWNIVYSFNDSDFEVSENILSLYLDEYEDTPWDALKYLIAGINYGGHVTDDWDRRLLLTYSNNYFCENAISIPNYPLSSLPEYYIPDDGEMNVYKEFISRLPVMDRPEAFGQHPNADITSMIIDTRTMCDTLLSIQGDSGGGAGEGTEQKVKDLADGMLKTIPDVMKYTEIYASVGPNKAPLEVVLLQEIYRYNTLLMSMKNLLRNLIKGIQGLVVMSADLDEIFSCLADGRVSSIWLKAYQSKKPLGSWTRDLIERVEFFSRWGNTLIRPVLYWLAAFTFPTGFLTAVFQTTARKFSLSVDLLTWEFTPQIYFEDDITEYPDDGVFIRGMYLEGAGWSWDTMALCEPGPMELVTPMPVILFRPVEMFKKRTRGIYVCPVYYFPERCATQGRESFVVAVDLKSGTSNAEHWVKRATAILLSLAT